MSQTDYYQKITPQGRWFDLGLGELWARRQLLWALVGRDLRVRYKNTLLGVVWVVLQPALSTLIFTLVLARLFRSGGDNYALYTLVGFTFWQFFSNSITAAAGSVYEQANMLRKIYFPRAFIPLTIVFRQLFDFGVGTLFLLAMMLCQGAPITLAGVGCYLLGIASLWLLTAGLSLAASALSVLYRDVRHLVPFAIQLWFYLTPIFYARELLAGRLAWLSLLNPVTGILDFVRAGLFGGELPAGKFALLALVNLAIGALGLAFFRHSETEIIDRA